MGPGPKPKVKSTTGDGALLPDGSVKGRADDPLTRPRSADVGGTLSDEMLEAKYGMPKSNIEKFKEFCRDFKLVLDVRPSNVESARLLNSGLLPKPELLKGKSIRPVDELLGWSKADIGRVGHKVPTDPELHPRWAELTPAERVDARKAYHDRLAAFEKYDAELRPYFDAGVIEVRDGVLYGRTIEGDMVAFTGDHDIFDVRWANGRRLTMDEYLFIRNEMRFRNMGAEHGAHMWWRETVPETFDPKLFEGIQSGHLEGPKADPLIRFGEGDPKAVWAEADAATGPKNEGGPEQNPFADFTEIKMLDAGMTPDPLPEGTLMVPPNPTDAAGAMDMYRTAAADDRWRRVNLFHNPTTGEYVVVQGNAEGAALDPARLAEVLDGRTDVGTWEPVDVPDEVAAP